MCLGYTNTNIDLDRFSARRGRPGYEEVAKTIVKEVFTGRNAIIYTTDPLPLRKQYPELGVDDLSSRINNIRLFADCFEFILRSHTTQMSHKLLLTRYNFKQFFTTVGLSFRCQFIHLNNSLKTLSSLGEITIEKGKFLISL